MCQTVPYPPRLSDATTTAVTEYVHAADPPKIAEAAAVCASAVAAKVPFPIAAATDVPASPEGAGDRACSRLSPMDSDDISTPRRAKRRGNLLKRG